MLDVDDQAIRVSDSPSESYRALFWRFLRFGALAWGGPVAQIGMLRHELVERERWIDPIRFNRVLAVYQALPGPEAHELCVYFGQLRKGRVGGLLAGLGFMLPGAALIFAIAWLYVAHGIDSPLATGLFWGFGAAAAALVVRATHRIGAHALDGRWLWAIAVTSAAAQLADVSFLVPIVAGGVTHLLARRGHRLLAGVALLAVLSVAVLGAGSDGPQLSPAAHGDTREPSLADVTQSGLRTGLLTFGGAYTAIPFLQHDAVDEGAWLEPTEFLDAIAVASVLPAPLIVFATFVGYVAAGPWAALAITAAIFAPAFAFTLVGHRTVERAVNDPRLHSFLDGITAAVVGLIAVAALALLRVAVDGLWAAALTGAVLIALYRRQSRLSLVALMAVAGGAGLARSLLF